MNDFTEKLKNAKDKVVEAGIRAKDSKAAEVVAKGIKVGANVAMKGAQVGANAVVKGAKAGAEKVKETVDGLGSDIQTEDGHTIVKLNGCKMILLLPDGYEKLKRTNIVNQIVKSVKNTEVAYRKIVDYSDDFVLICKTDRENTMDCSDIKGLIDGIHECLAENQGLIEAKNGVTKRGYKYIYSIVKTLNMENGFSQGVMYFLRMTLNLDDEYIEINGSFSEQGMIGLRESMCMELANRAGLMDFAEKEFEGWSEDPYDPSYKKGIQKNLAEREGIDGLFPYSPLTQAREFVLAIINDELVIINKEDDDTSTEQDDNKDFDEKEYCLGLFEDRCRRHRYPVEIDVANK